MSASDSTYFYKAVTIGHILGLSLIPSERGPGIKLEGLDPLKRNASGGATVVEAAQSGRQLSEADATGFGQCLSGHITYATDYAEDKLKDAAILRITLPSSFLKNLVESAKNHTAFKSMADAAAASECTAIAKIPPAQIEYQNDEDGWTAIGSFNRTDCKTYPLD